MQKRAQENNDCYYINYSTCTCSSSPNCDRKCVGKEDCGQYISGDDYFAKMMDGTLETAAPEDTKERAAQVRKNLSLGKSKKQLKREQKLEDEKNGVGQGYSLRDDPRFRGMF